MKRNIKFVKELMVVIFLISCMAGCDTTNINDVPELPESYSYSLTPEQTAEVLSIIKRHSSTDLYIIPNIPDKKLVNARKANRVPANEKILCLVNAAVWGGAKNSLLVGLSGIYFRNDWKGDSPGHHFFSYSELQNVVINSSGWFEMSVGGINFDMSGCSMPRKKLISMLQEIQTVIKKQPPGQISEFAQAAKKSKPQVVQSKHENKDTEIQLFNARETPVAKDIGEKNTQLIEAAKEGNIEVVKASLSNGADVNTKDKDNVPVLILAAINGHTAVVKLLLEKGADVNTLRTDDVVRAFGVAQWEGNLEIISLILEKVNPYEKVKHLGNIIIALAPSASMIFDNFKGVESFNINKPTQTEEKLLLNVARCLLASGVEYDLVRIAGFKKPGIKNLGAANVYSTGDRGRVVPKSEGGLSLIEYCEINELINAHKLLSEYDTKAGEARKTSIQNPLVEQAAEKNTLKVVPQESQNKDIKPQSFKAGGIPVIIPSPNREMVEVSYDNRELMEVFVPASNRLLATFVLTNELSLLTEGDEELTLSKYAMVEVPRRGEYTNFSESKFEEFTDYMKEKFGDIIDSTSEEAEEEFNRRMKSLDVDDATIRIGDTIQLGSLFSKKDAYGYGAITSVSMGGETTKLALGCAVLRVKEKMLFVYLYVSYRDENTIKWLRKTSESWADAILEANK